tara:strand:- start:297 stop:743 length:447 start_codon:yes stop_codon:yes gene_type:complete
MFLFDDEPNYDAESKMTQKYIRVENDYVGWVEVSSDYQYWVKDIPRANDLGACIEFVLRMMQPGGCFYYLGQEYPESSMDLQLQTKKLMDGKGTYQSIYKISFKKWERLWKQGLIGRDLELQRIYRREQDEEFEEQIRRLDAELDALK